MLQSNIKSYEYDFFISHATEDKESFVRDLANKLGEKYRVWYDEFSLKAGYSLRSSIDKGLSSSEYGIVVLSPDFFRKVWTNRELDGLLAKETQGRRVILPVWHNVEYEDVLEYSPILADRLGVSSSHGLDHVVDKITHAISIAANPDNVSNDLGLSFDTLIPTVDYSTTSIEGFERKQISENHKVELLDEDLIIKAFEITVSSDASLRLSFGDYFGMVLRWFSHLSFGPIYSAWRTGRKVFLSTLPQLDGVSQKTYEFELLESPKRLSLVAEWKPKEEGWNKITTEQFYEVMDGKMADSSGCDLLRESILLILQSRNLSFRFPVTPPETQLETFCQWVFWKEPLDKAVDWDKNPLLVSEMINAWQGYYHHKTQEGILIFRVMGRWTNRSLETFRNALEDLIPTRYLIDHIRHGSMRVCVHVLDGAQYENNDLRDPGYAWEAFSRTLAAIARMVASKRGLVVSPPMTDSTIPKLPFHIEKKFKEAVKTLSEDEYPTKVHDNHISWFHDRTDTWGYLKRYSKPNFCIESLPRFDWQEIVRNIDLFNYVDTNENRKIPAILDFLLSLEKDDTDHLVLDILNTEY